MLKDITLGQYFPGSSPLHRLDPRTKIILTIVYIVGVFLADSVSAFIAVTAFTAALVLISRIPMRTVIVGMKPLIFIIAFTVIVNVFWAKGEHLLFEWGIIHIYAEGLMTALLVTLRIAALLTGTSIILTYTTSPTALTDGLERLLAPLARLHVPVHDFAMMMTIALRFIPTLIEETDKIMNAQRARGVDFSHGNLIERAKALIPVLIPLFLSAIRRASGINADELSYLPICSAMPKTAISNINYITAPLMYRWGKSVRAARPPRRKPPLSAATRHLPRLCG